MFDKKDTCSLQKIEFKSPGYDFLSVIIPCFNEEEVIKETYHQLINILGKDPTIHFELIFVDDGSYDSTLNQLKEFCYNNNCVKIVELSRNFGHQIAITAGLEHASGNVVGIIDADLQDPPEVILEMLIHWRKGADIVYGVRDERRGESWIKIYSALLFYKLISYLVKKSVPIHTGDFRLMDRKVVDALLEMPERYRFIRGMVAWTGFKQVPVHFHRSVRFAGKTKYSFKKMLTLAMDGIFSFSKKPLELGLYLGFFSILLSFIGMAYMIALRWSTGHWLSGFVILLIVMIFIGGVQLFTLGIMSEYIGRIYGEIQQRPLYFMKNKYGFSSESKVKVHRMESYKK